MTIHASCYNYSVFTVSSSFLLYFKILEFFCIKLNFFMKIGWINNIHVVIRVNILFTRRMWCMKILLPTSIKILILSNSKFSLWMCFVIFYNRFELFENAWSYYASCYLEQAIVHHYLIYMYRRGFNFEILAISSTMTTKYFYYLFSPSQIKLLSQPFFREFSMYHCQTGNAATP